MDRQHNGQKKKEQTTNLQSITHKTKDLVTRAPLKILCMKHMNYFTIRNSVFCNCNAHTYVDLSYTITHYILIYIV